MTQNASRTCPRCGNEVPAGQRFCSSCGLSMSDEVNRPTALSGETPSDVADMATREATPMPPPPPSVDGPQYTRYQPDGSLYSQQTPPPPPMNPGQMPSQPPIASYATPQKGNSGKVWRGIGCGVGVAVLILLVICGSIGYFVYNGARATLSNVSKTATAQPIYSSGGGSNDVTPTLGPTTKTAVGSTITYASDNLTITDVQQAQSFADDNRSSQATGIARLNLKEQNTASRNANFLYSDIARLLLPDGSTVEPLNEQQSISPDASVSRANWLDFPVPKTVKPSQLTLVLGANEDAQMSMPLTGSADLSKYKPKTASPNKTFQHEGLNWTMTAATTSWSSKATQAKKGMVYITIDFKIDNPSQKDVVEYWNSYLRLKVGDAVSSPDSNTDFPTDFPVGSSGKTASAIFLVPQGSTAYTFILLASSDGTVPQTSSDFQIQ